jgi:hypothetical protein
VAGVSWASLIKPLAVVDQSDFAAYSNIAAAIEYTVDHGRAGDQYQHRGSERVVHPAGRRGLCLEKGSRHLLLGDERHVVVAVLPGVL